MKKFFLAALVAVSAASFTACGQSVPSASLKTDVDSMSYAIGVAQTRGLKDYLAMRMNVDTAYMDDFVKGLLEGADAGDSKKKAAYYAGIQIGQQMGTQAVKGINFEAFGDDSTKTISLQNFMSGFANAVLGNKCEIDVNVADSIAEALMEKFRSEKLMKQYGENKTAGEEFLAKNAENDSVVVLPSGVQYKILKKGNGAVPTADQTVTVHYEGTLIDGTVFDSSYKRNKPMDMGCSQGIKGWNEAIQMMPVGSTWMVYIPQELAYGATPRGGNIKPFSALVFKIELLSIKK